MRIRERVAVLDRLLCQEPHADRKIGAHPLAHARHDAAEKAQPPFERAPVVEIAARIVPGEERGERIGVRGMQLDAVVSGFPRPRRRRAELLDDGVDVLEAQAVDLLPPARARHLHEVDDLRQDLGARGVVDAPHEVAVARDVVVTREPQQRARFAVVDGGRLHDDEPDMALGVTDIAVAHGLVDEAVFARKPRHHGGHHHAIGEREPVDRERLEEPHGSAPVAASTWPAITSFWISLVPS